MKHTNKIILSLLLTIVFVSITACTSNFESYNRNQYEVTLDEMMRENYILGSTMIGLQNMVVPTNQHLYQFVELLAGCPFAGYIAATPTWTDKFETYNPPTHWQNAHFADIMSKTYPLYREILSRTTDEVPLALAKLFRVATMHRLTDAYGPIPYSKVISENGEVALNVAYDSQKEVYLKMLSELDEILVVLIKNRDISPETFERFDDVYAGNIDKWVKFSNSLKLRMAMRMVYVEPELAKKTAEEAVAAGVITTNDESAYLKVKLNPLVQTLFEWNDHRAGADIISHMNGYKDPRRSYYFTEALEGGFAGPRIGIDNHNKDRAVAGSSTPIVAENSPFLWMNAAEVNFLRAEGALRGWNMGAEAQELYEAGIKLSFDEHGAQGADAYIQNETDRPGKFDDPMGYYSQDALSNTAIKWDDKNNFETNLEQIITQKWIAIFPLGHEAWAEFRRTGYPKLFPVHLNKSGGTIDSKKMIRRLNFPPVEYSENAEYIHEAITLLGGSDNGGTPLWWDKKE